jgi:hypothetical protein
MNWEEIQNDAENLVKDGYQKLTDSQLFDWSRISKIPQEAGVSAIYKGKELLYVGESENIYNKFAKHYNNPNSKAVFRRNLAEVKLGIPFKKNEKGKKVSTLPEAEIIAKTEEYIKSCCFRYLIVELGRTELKEYIIKRYSPVLNKK